MPNNVGSSGGVRALLNGQCDLAHRPPLKAWEKAQEPHLQEPVFARSPVVFAAKLPSTCVDNLTAGQMVKIFDRVIDDWSEHGDCPPNNIYVAQRTCGAGPGLRRH